MNPAQTMRLLTGDSVTFGYDTLSRLKTRKIANQVLETYTYDTYGSFAKILNGRIRIDKGHI